MHFSITARYRYQLYPDLYSYFDLGSCYKDDFETQAGTVK